MDKFLWWVDMIVNGTFVITLIAVFAFLLYCLYNIVKELTNA
jgi:hypothetical protein